MAGKYMGNICAYIKAPGAEKGTYKRIGEWFQDDDGRISGVIDCLPLSHTAWKGWINLFENDGGFTSKSVVKRKEHQQKQNYIVDPDEGDIPF